MNSTILDAFDYLNSINNMEDIKLTEKLHNLLPVCYIKENNKYVKKVYNIIGFFSYDLEEFVWAWCTNISKFLHYKTNQIITHGINIEAITMSDFYIKKLLTSSNIKTKNDNIVQIILALGCYLTKAHSYSIKTPPDKNFAVFYVFYDIKEVEELGLNLNL